MGIKKFLTYANDCKQNKAQNKENNRSLILLKPLMFIEFR